jgi:Zn-dependent peptidase ImmA (M78 family)
MNDHRKSAAGSTIPFLHEKQIEREAALLLDEYAMKFSPVIAPPVPVDEIVENHLNLTLVYLDMKSLFPFADVHGAIWFNQGKIGIEQTLDPYHSPNRRGRYHFTLAHEVGHWRLHRQHYMANTSQRLLFDDGTPRPDVVCRSSEIGQPVEWQANTFAACLLMPRKMVHEAWDRLRGDDAGAISIGELRQQYSTMDESVFIRGEAPTNPETRDQAIKEHYCRPLAETFQVSPEAMRIRLESLNLFVTMKAKTLF